MTTISLTKRFYQKVQFMSVMTLTYNGLFCMFAWNVLYCEQCDMFTS